MSVVSSSLYHGLSDLFATSEKNYWRELTVDKTLVTYSRDLSCAVAACLRSVMNPTQAFCLPMTEDARRVARKLHQELESGQAEWKSLHPVIKTLWHASESVLEGNECPFLLHFLAAAALRKDGTLMDSKQLVAWITHLKYSAWAFCMVEAKEFYLPTGMHRSILE